MTENDKNVTVDVTINDLNETEKTIFGYTKEIQKLPVHVAINILPNLRFISCQTCGLYLAKLAVYFNPNLRLQK